MNKKTVHRKREEEMASFSEKLNFVVFTMISHYVACTVAMTLINTVISDHLMLSDGTALGPLTVSVQLCLLFNKLL